MDGTGKNGPPRVREGQVGESPPSKPSPVEGEGWRGEGGRCCCRGGLWVWREGGSRTAPTGEDKRWSGFGGWGVLEEGEGFLQGVGDGATRRVALREKVVCGYGWRFLDSRSFVAGASSG